MEKRHDWNVADRPGIPGDRWLCHEEVLGTGILRRGNAPAIDVEAEVFRLAERERKLEALVTVIKDERDSAQRAMFAALERERKLRAAALRLLDAQDQFYKDCMTLSLDKLRSKATLADDSIGKAAEALRALLKEE